MEQAELQSRLKALPTKPGVYIFKDAIGTVIYVGKAVSLRDRVRSYFRARVDSPKTRRLVHQIADFEYIVTDSELEALVLECNLIKQHRPRYNIRLRDDKSYPYIKVTLSEEWPRVHVTRRLVQDGSRYFGPFTDTKSVWRTLDLIHKLFPYRSCDREITGRDERPCLDYHIGRCLGPCIGAVDKATYMQAIQQLCQFLEGKHEAVTADLRRQMEEASDNLEFERAAVLRDRILAVEKVTERQKVLSTTLTDEDAIAFARSNGEACVQVFFIRGGKLIGREHFLLEGTQDEDAHEIMASFITQFYEHAPYVPPSILLQNGVDEAAVIESWLRNKRGDRVAIRVPRKGQDKQLIDMVAENAAETLEQLRARWLADEKKTTEAIAELAEYLDLPGAPQRIECYDVSNVQGTNSVGSMVVFEGGQPKNSQYRRFRIKTVEGANDYASLQEVLRRRFKRADSTSSWAVAPDLVIVDGGKGQLNAALEVMQELGIDTVPVAGLAKEQEELFLPGREEPVLLPRSSQSLYLVQRIRDEAHRFALAYHQRLRNRSGLASVLEEIPGIGPKRRAALFRHFGSLQAIRSASLEELAAVEGMTLAAAQAVKDNL